MNIVWNVVLSVGLLLVIPAVIGVTALFGRCRRHQRELAALSDRLSMEARVQAFTLHTLQQMRDVVRSDRVHQDRRQP